MNPPTNNWRKRRKKNHLSYDRDSGAIFKIKGMWERIGILVSLFISVIYMIPPRLGFASDDTKYIVCGLMYDICVKC